MKTKNLLKKLIISSLILLMLAIYSINFNSDLTYILILGGLAISLLDFMLSILLGMHKKLYSKFLISLISAILIIYCLQFITEGFFISLNITIIAAITYSSLSNVQINTKKK